MVIGVKSICVEAEGDTQELGWASPEGVATCVVTEEDGGVGEVVVEATTGEGKDVASELVQPVIRAN